MKGTLFKRGSRAFGLLEVILVFAIAIGATAALWAVYPSARRSADASRDVSLVQTLSANISEIYGHGDTSGLAFASWIQGGSLGVQNFCPPDPDTGLTVCYSALTGEPIGISERAGCTGTGPMCANPANQYGFGWSFVFQDITTEQCLAMLSAPTGAAAYEVVKPGSGLTFLKVSGSSYADILSLCTNVGQDLQPLDRLELDYTNQPGVAAQYGW